MKAFVAEKLAVLRAKCKTEMPVKVRITDRIDPEDFADSARGEDHFEIRIWSGLSQELQVHFLVHEWAHCVSWTISETGGHPEHNHHWGLAHADAYRMVYDE